MSRYLNFYSIPYARDESRVIGRILRCLESDCAEFPEPGIGVVTTGMEAIAIFDTSTTPPTYVKSWQSINQFVGKHPKFPATHIDSKGNIIRTSDHSIVMPA